MILDCLVCGCDQMQPGIFMVLRYWLLMLMRLASGFNWNECDLPSMSILKTPMSKNIHP